MLHFDLIKMQFVSSPFCYTVRKVDKLFVTQIVIVRYSDWRYLCVVSYGFMFNYVWIEGKFAAGKATRTATTKVNLSGHACTFLISPQHLRLPNKVLVLRVFVSASALCRSCAILGCSPVT